MAEHDRFRNYVLDHARTILNLRRAEAESMSLDEITAVLERYAKDVRTAELCRELEEQAIRDGSVTAGELGKMSEAERSQVRRALRVMDELGCSGAPPRTPRTVQPSAEGARWPGELVLAIAKLIEIAARQQELISMLRQELTLLDGRSMDATSTEGSVAAAASGVPATVAPITPLGRTAVSEIEGIGSYVAALGGSMNVDLLDLHERLEQMARADRRTRTLEIRRGKLPRVG